MDQQIHKSISLLFRFENYDVFPLVFNILESDKNLQVC